MLSEYEISCSPLNVYLKKNFLHKNYLNISNSTVVLVINGFYYDIRNPIIVWLENFALNQPFNSFNNKVLKRMNL